MKNLDGQDNLPSEEELVRQIVEAGRSVYAAFDAVDEAISKSLRLHRSDLRCLNLLESGPLKASEIGQRLGLSSGSVTALIDRLEKAGFVERQRSTVDRRSVEVHIPEACYGRIAQLYKLVAASVQKRFSGTETSKLQTSAIAISAFAEACQSAADQLSDEL